MSDVNSSPSSEKLLSSEEKAGLVNIDEFLQSKEETLSPILNAKSRKWAKNIAMKRAGASAVLWLLCLIFSFFNPVVSHFFLVFVFFFAGTPAMLETVRDLKEFKVNIDTLMTLAAYLSITIGAGREGALLLVLFDLSHGLEHMVSDKAMNALHQLKELAPSVAHILNPDGTTIEKSIHEITTGTKILVRSGDVVPLDGLVEEGQSYVNLVHLTGESTPVPKKPEDEVQAGSRNLDGSLTLKVTKTSAESTLTKIIELIHRAQAMKPKLQRFLDRFGPIYSSTIILLFFLFALALPLIFSMPYFGLNGSIYRSLAFLIAASPCALIIATPTAYLAAISVCAKKGILLKGGITLDAFAKCRQIAFDKTGTLTTGDLFCKEIEPLNEEANRNLDEVLAIAYALEQQANHPIASAIKQYARAQKVLPAKVRDYQAHAGQGLYGVYEEKRVYLGNLGFIQSNTNLQFEDISGTKTFLAIGSELYLIRFEDKLRPEAGKFIQELKPNYEVIMLTGDHLDSATRVSEELGIDRFFADLKPEDKLKAVTELTESADCAMVGDGINDAPALARATVGIAMGKIGSATAIDAADIVLLQDRLEDIAWLNRKAKKTLRIIRENLTLALGVIFLASFPALMGYVPLWLAVVLHEGGTLLVGLNSLRLLKK